MSTGSRASIAFLSLIFMFCYSHAANNTLTSGQSIQDGQTMVSPSETFALGFFSPATNSRNRYLGIWYNKIPVRTIVWVANRENPVSDSSGVMTFGSDGNLVVLDGTGRSLWSTNVSVGANNATAFLRDSGNLCLSVDQACDPEKALWHSFEDPTDTYLPGMRVFLSPRSRKDLLTSWRSDTDPARGNFSVGIDPQGLLQLVQWNGEAKRWRSGLWNGQIFIGVPSMVGNYLYGSRVTDLGGKSFFSYVARNSSDIFRFQIKWDGSYKLMFWDEGRKDWSTYWAETQGKCELYNRCGAYGSCSISTTPICSCLRGFVPKSKTEWDSGNWSSGCVRRTELQCDRNATSEERDQFLELDRVKLPDFYASVKLINKTQCANDCSKNCSCLAYAYVDGIQCLTWAQGFVDVQIFPAGGQKLSIRLAASEIATAAKSTRKNKPTLVIAVVVAVGVIFVCTSAYLWWKSIAKSRNGKKETILVDVGPDGNGSELAVHSLQDILDATDNFSDSNTLGQGGFGPVYKGRLPGGLAVAVKRLSRKSTQGLREFKNEIILIAKLQHRNLVRLIGYCVEGEEKILVYEYLPNKSLDVFIFGKLRDKLNSVQRCSIIEGVARGLLYLHRDSRLRIIHRDLKVSNILLDEDLNPKISDFGMAKIFGGEQNQAETNRVAGTYGYMAPEYAMQGIFSVKSDVYSFGVLLLEIISGKRNQYTHPEYSVDLIGYAWKLWSEERAIEFIDPLIRDSLPGSQASAMRCINIGLLCVQDSAMDRPIMSTVVQMLENDTAILPIPGQPTFTVVRNTTEQKLSLDSSLGQSRTSMTNTLVIGR